MGKKGSKLELLRILRGEESSLSLIELHAKLGRACSERTLRRWLSELAKEGLVQKVGLKKAMRYKPSPSGTSLGDGIFSTRSVSALSEVKKPIFQRKPTCYQKKWIQSYIPNETGYIPKNIREKLHRIGKRTKRKEPGGTYARHIYNRILIDLSYNSSRLEGNTYSLIDTKKLLLEGKGAKGKLDQEKIMILNHKEAIRYLVDKIESLRIIPPVICTIQYLLSDGLVSPEYSGKIRDQGVRIEGTAYIPMENPSEVEQELQVVCDIADQIQDPFEQAFFLLVHISYLQAFIDVNKRTARLACNIPLLKNNCVPLSFNDIEKEDFISSMLAVYEKNDIYPILDLFFFSYERSCQLHTVTLEALDFDPIRVYYRDERREIIRHIITHLLIGNEIKEYVDKAVPDLVDSSDVESVLDDIYEDLRIISPERIAGMGITTEELQLWMNKRSTQKKEP